ncbi:hypothetical protein [Ruminococcus flavefaciens]|uniref:hypothetical protein n=1 Tax=Ruminococcus flavefaciens TaxID=1265 RepID=UPI0004674E98|nr:hypothetical protein [Ruminococcus flavefaciens]
MKEIGGYIEFETFRSKMLYDDGIKLNCGRNAFAYLIETENIKKVCFPKMMCDSDDKVLGDYGVEVRYYSIDRELKMEDIVLEDDEWLYVVNYYGQLTDEYIKSLKKKYGRIILDNAQAYFQRPVAGIDTVYTCRKFFGVPDGAVLYTDTRLDRELPVDESFSRINFLVGRFERTASEFYCEYAANNDLFFNEPIKRMSRLTENLLRSIDYDFIENRRTENFTHYNEELASVNKLRLIVPRGAFMYPFYTENGNEARAILKDMKIYIPTLWPNVFDKCTENDAEYDLAENILPLPCDQRYSYDEIKYVIEVIKNV